MNFDLAAELAAAEGIEVAGRCSPPTTSPRRRRSAETRRRGIAGIFFLYKVAGASGRRGRDRSTRCVAVDRAGSGRAPQRWASRSRRAPFPPAGRPTFELPAGEMEIGMGIHGEPGVRRGPLETADDVADELVDAILADLPLSSGATGRRARERPRRDAAGGALHPVPPRSRSAGRRRGAHPSYWIGEYATSLEMAGASVSVLRLDDELAELLDAPASAPLLARV